VQQLPFEQPCHRLQPDVGMGADVEAGVGRNRAGAHLVDETPRSDAAALLSGQHSPHCEPTDLRFSTVEYPHDAFPGGLPPAARAVSSLLTGPLIYWVLPGQPPGGPGPE
jgi:hypothetical protein